MKQTISKYLKALSDLLIPRTCIICDRKLIVEEKHICLKCMLDIPYTYFWTLSRNPMADKLNEILQEWMDKERLDKETYAYACALFFFNSDAGYIRIPYQLKYHGDITAGRFFARLLAERISSSPHLSDVDLVVPVPLHSLRKWERGYNQAEIIAEEIAGTLNCGIRCDILKRKRRTRTQTKMSVEEKSANVADAFTTIEEEGLNLAMHHRHILIVDDVFTTGSTVAECYISLRKKLPPAIRISVATLGFVGRA